MGDTWQTYVSKRKKLYITRDCDGSNGNRVKMWKYQLQQFANRTRLEVFVSHFPLGATQSTTDLTVICVRDDTKYELAKKSV
jgi:hypothetical protein